MWSPSQIAARRAARRRPAFYTSINLWGLVSILVALLSLFIADTSPHQHQWVSVDLPFAQSAVSEPRAWREDAIRVSVTRNGMLYFRRDRITPEGLLFLIQKALKEGAVRRVYLAADGRAEYGDAEVAVDQIQAAGITNVVILANKSNH